VTLVHQDQQVHLVILDLQVLLDQVEHLEALVVRGQLEHQDHQDRLVQLEHQVLQEILEHQELVVHLDHQGQLETLVLKDHKDLLDL
jgi:hypothetical protein